MRLSGGNEVEDCDQLETVPLQPVVQLLQIRQLALEAQIASLRSEFEAEADEIATAIAQELAREERLDADRADMARSRRADPAARPAPRRTNGQGGRK